MQVDRDKIEELQLETALKEYQFIRDEMLQRQNQRMNMTYILLLATATLWVGASQSETPWLVGVLFGVAPLFSFLILYQVYESYRLHDIQATRLKGIESKVEKLLHGEVKKEEESDPETKEAKDGWLWWQHYFGKQVEDRKVKSLVRKNTYLLIMWVSIFVPLLAILLKVVMPLEMIKAIAPLLNGPDVIVLFLSVLVACAYLVCGVLITHYYCRLGKQEKD